VDDIYGNREYEGCEVVVIFWNGLHEGLLRSAAQIPAKLEQDFYEILPGFATFHFANFDFVETGFVSQILPGPAKVYKDFTFTLHKKVEKD